MPRPSKLSPDQWQAVRQLWQGDARPGFGWLARVVLDMWSVEVLPQALSQAARLKGWAKGGPVHPQRADPNIQSEANIQPTPNIPATSEATSGRPRPRTPKRSEEGAARAAAAGAAPTGGSAGAAPQVEDRKAKPGEKRAYGSRIRHLPAADPAEFGVRPVPRLPEHGRLGIHTNSAYRPEYADMLLAYFDTPAWRDVIVEVHPGITKTQQVPNPFPTFERFAVKIGVTVDTLREWATSTLPDGSRRHPEFARAHAQAHALQKARTVEGCMGGVYEPRAGQLALKNIAGWSDQPKEEHEASPVNDMALALEFEKSMEAARARQEEVLSRRAALLATDGRGA